MTDRELHTAPSPFAPGRIDRLAERGELRRYAKGTRLIQEGDRGELVYVIRQGSLRAFGDDPVSGRLIIHGTYGPGDLVGEMGLDGGPRAASVVTLTPTTCAVLSRPTLERFMADEPGFALELLAVVIGRARSATRAARELALHSVYERLRDLLERAAVPEPQGGLRALPARWTHLEMAGRIGCTREMVSRILRELEKDGLLRQREDGRLLLTGTLPARW